MNVSNAAYSLPLTEYKPGLQKEGIDPLRTADEETSWYAPIEKVTPRVYHKYAKQSLLDKLYGSEEKEDEPKEDEGEGKTDGDLKEDNQPETPETPAQPENPTSEPETPAQPENPTTEPEATTNENSEAK